MKEHLSRLDPDIDWNDRELFYDHLNGRFKVVETKKKESDYFTDNAT